MQDVIFRTIKAGEIADDSTYLFYGGSGVTYPFLRMSEGYKKAADKLVATVGLFEDSLVFPICFLYRHAIELRLKAIFFFATMSYNCRVAENDVARIKDLDKNHNLQELWEEDKRVLADTFLERGIDQEHIAEVDYGVNQVADFDSSSFEMRYPCKKKRDPIMGVELNETHKETHGLDITALAKGYGQLWDNLGRIVRGIDDELTKSFRESLGPKG